jgi:hypothetical protein
MKIINKINKFSKIIIFLEFLINLILNIWNNITIKIIKIENFMENFNSYLMH